MLTNAAAPAILALTNASAMLTKTAATTIPAPAPRFFTQTHAAAPAAFHFTKHASGSERKRNWSNARGMAALSAAARCSAARARRGCVAVQSLGKLAKGRISEAVT